MINPFYILLCAIFLISCGGNSPAHPKLVSLKVETSGIGCGENSSTLESSERTDLRHIKLDLYIDSIGTIYHRTIDVSTMEGDGYYRYTNYARLYPDGNNDYIIQDLNTMIDTLSFKQTDKESINGRTTYFEDASYNYSLFSVADGGVLSVRPK